MKIFYQDEIVRGHNVAALIEERGWAGYRIDTENFYESVREIDGRLQEEGGDDPIFGFAGLRLASQQGYLGIRKMQQGIVMDKGKLTWSNYATLLPSSLLLNPFGILFPWGFLLDDRAIQTMKSAYGEEGVFLRPNSPLKPFTGFATPWENYEFNIQTYRQLEAIDPGEMAIAFPRKEIDQVEWRFWVVAGNIATYSPYSWEELPQGQLSVPDGMISDVTEVIRYLEGYEDSLVIDMVKTGGGNKVVELNGLTTSGFYDGMDVGALLDSLPQMYGL